MMTDQGPARILYIDDDATLVRLVQKVLGRRGFQVVHAEDPDQIVAHVESGAIQAIVLDHYLRNGTGKDILQRLRESNHHLPVIYVTGSSEAQVAIDAMKAGAADYVTKTTGDDFLPLLATAIEQALANERLRIAKEQADAEIRRAKERAEALLAEVNHRVANSLAMVSGLLRLQAARSRSEEAKAELTETHARITAIARMHRALYTSEDVRHVEMDKYLGTLIDDLNATMQHEGRDIPVLLTADGLNMTADRAVSVGMIVAELVTNAMKYAYDPDSGGEIRVRFARCAPDRALLSVEDDGAGFDPSAAPVGTGLGTSIINSMASSLETELRYVQVPRGTRAEAEIPLI
ncbi:histidine kinase dimerization/phosphoacceptor domain -containing protein [Plastorhodobacter daqingensis]|uniref:histidine kinase n=1 Tax=Plastorhodobacter daqingensis TaxID=1387281 RepID=A0ABW2UN49_9RHOB